jgi:hypothetical protein
VYDLTAADLAGLTLSAPDNIDFDLTVTAISTETSTGGTASASDTLNVIILDVSPTIALSGFYTPAGGLDPYIANPDEFAALIRRDYAKYAKVVKDIGIKVD